METYAYSEARMLEGILAYKAELRQAHKPRVRQTFTDWHADAICAAVAEEFSVYPTDLVGRAHSEHLATPRHLAILLCREILGWSSPRIGKYFSRHHTTVLASVDVAKAVRLSSGRIDSWYRSAKGQLSFSFGVDLNG